MDNVHTGRDPLFFGGETAVEYWRRASRRGVRPKPVAGITLKSAPDLKHLAESSYNVRAMANLRGMLHVYVSNTGCVPKGKFGVPFNVKLPDPRFAPHGSGAALCGDLDSYRCEIVTAKMVAHRLSTDSSVGSYCFVAPGVYVASPTLALLQCAGSLPLPSLMQLAYEFCGMFSVDVLNPKGYIERLPLTDSSSVSAAIDQFVKSGPARGSGALKIVSDRLIDGIRCPSAAALCSLFCAPVGSGGYALPTPRAGVLHRLVSEEIDGGIPCRILIDLLWTKWPDRPDMDWSCGQSIGVIVCDGGMRSSKRIIELHESVPNSRNIALVCLSASDLQSRATCNSVAKMIRGVVGGKRPKPVGDYDLRNESMRSDLFESVSIAS